MKKTLLAILVAALVLRLIFAFSYHEVWWDSGVYVGMGKFMFSGGEIGLWEHIRPVFMPFVLGTFWTLGLDPILFGRLFEIFLMVGVVYLTYLLSREWFSERTALLSALIVALSPIFFYLSFHQYTEIPSTFFVLLGLYLLLHKHYFFSGLSIGIAFLTKFPSGMFIVLIGLYLILNREWKFALLSTIGFSFAALPYFIWSRISYGGLFATFLAAQDAINRALGCNVLRYKPWWHYFDLLVSSETVLHIFSLLGLYALVSRWQKKQLLFSLCLFIPLIYFMTLHCRDYRYLTLFLPFIAMLTALGITWLYDKLFSSSVFPFILIGFAAMMTFTALMFYYGNEVQTPNEVSERYFSYLNTHQTNKEIWTANPIIAAYVDARLEKIYYPIYDAGISRDFSSYLDAHRNRIGAVLLDNCGGGIICPPDENCKENELIAQLDLLYTRVFDEQHGRCWYRIWMN